MAIRLFQTSTSMFCEKIRIVLALKKVSYETLDVKKDNRRSLIDFSGQRKVSVMDYHGERVIDSTMITAFLEERHPTQSIYPANPADKGLALLLEDWADEVLNQAVLAFRRAGDEAGRAAAAKNISVHLENLNRFFSRQGFIFDTMTIADLAIFTQLHYLYTSVKYEIPPVYANLRGWMDFLRGRLGLATLYDLA
jgi:glutathione S-transferase